MANTKAIAKLDEKLMEEGIVASNIQPDYKKVHSFLNTHVRKNGQILTEENFIKGETALRDWLMVLYKKGASQEKLTSYLRVGLAHLCYDFVESNYSKIDSTDLLARTLVSFKNRKYHKTFFKGSLDDKKASLRGKKELKQVAKKKSSKTQSKSKPSSKKSKVQKPPTKAKAKKTKEKKQKKKGFFSFLGL